MNTFGRALCLSFTTSDCLYLIFKVYLPCFNSGYDEEHEMQCFECMSFVSETM